MNTAVPALDVDGLSFSYGDKPILKELRFTLETGKFMGLLGPNGAGKSTLIALLTRLLASPRGDIQIFGQSLQKKPGTALSQLGIVFQQTTLDLDLTVLQNLRYHAALQGMSPRYARSRIGEELERFALQDHSGTPVRALNGGHRRRVELARALLHRPRLLLLDEASAGLDVASRTQLNHYVRQLCRDENITALWTSHLIEEFTNNDDILILHRGESKAFGTAAVLLETHGVTTLQQLFSTLTDKTA